MPRVDVGGMICHALNRANFRSRVFREAAHCEDLPGIVEESSNSVLMRQPVRRAPVRGAPGLPRAVAPSVS